MKEKYFTIENIKSVTEDILNKLVAANPRKRKWEPKGNTALLITDMQNYFLEPNSHAYIPAGEAIIQNINLLINHCKQKSIPVVFTRHFNNEENAGMMGIWWKDLIKRDSSDFQIAKPVHTGFPHRIIDKQHYNAFMHTELEGFLLDHAVEDLIIAGVMTNLCCETTLRSAFMRGFNVVMPIDATATYNLGFHFSTFLNLSFGFAPVHTTTEIIEILEQWRLQKM